MKIGFDIIEVGENNIVLSIEDKEKIISTIKSRGLRYHWKIGKRDPRHQLSIDKTLAKIEEVMKVDKRIGGGGSDNGRQ